MKRCAVAALAALLFVVTSLFVVAPTGAAFAQAGYPSRTIKLVVPFPPGGSTDLVARLVGQHLEQSLKQPVIIENRAGAGTTIGATAVARAEPDGYTLLMAVPSTMLATIVQPNTAFKMEDFVAIAPFGEVPNVLAVSAEIPVTTLREFIDYTKARPGQLNYGTFGKFSMTHLFNARFNQQAGIDMVDIVYPGSGPAQTALAGNHIQAMFDAPPAALGNAQAGKSKLLAVSSAQRIPPLPGVPTFAELGYPVMTKGAWFALLAPSGTPQPVIDRLATAVNEVLAKPDVRAKISDVGVSPLAMSQPQFAAYLKDDYAFWNDIARSLGAAQPAR